MRVRWLLPLCLWLYAGIAGAAGVTPAVDLSRLDGRHDLAGAVSLLVDPTGARGWQDVVAADAAGDFRPVDADFARGYTTDALWLRIGVLAAPGNTRSHWLQVLPPFLDDLQLYVVADGVLLHHQQRGDRHPVAAIELPSGATLLQLPKLQQPAVLYLRVQTTSSMTVSLRLWHEHALEFRQVREDWYLGIYFGVLLAILVLNLFNAALLRERIFLLYCAYLGAQVLYGLATTGAALQHLPAIPAAMADRGVGLSLGLTIAVGIPFYLRVLAMPPGSWRWRLLNGVAVLAALVGLSAFTDRYVQLAWLLQSSVLLLFLLAGPLAWRHLRRGRGQQRLAGGAFLLYMAPVLVSIANYAGVIHLGQASLVSPFLANLVHIWLLHLALARQIREVEQEKQQLAQDAVVARAQVEQQRQQAEDHERFLAMIAHEIRTPISVVRAANESLRVLGSDESSLRELRHERIERAVRRMDLLLELALRRGRELEPGVSGQPAQAVDLVALTREVLAQFSDRDGIGLAAPATPATVLAHPDLLHFVLVNLLDNACRYAPPGTPVQVHIAAVQRDGRDGWCWSIEDGGPGVPVADRERIFGRYVRLDERAGAPGLGLGLYIALGLVERDGGQLHCVEPLQFGGARFEIWLPGAAATPAGDGA